MDLLPGKQVYYRLIALWAVCEAVIGGMIHGLHLPISGLIVGGCAVVIICLLSWYVPGKKFILEATVLVCIFKMLLSPHSPPAAYFAVLFQGATGAVILSGRNGYKWRCVAFGTLALFESGIQRILVMTLIYGTGFWKALDAFIGSLVSAENAYSLYIAGGYVVVHILAGAAIGWYAQSIPRRVNGWRKETFTAHLSAGKETAHRRRRLKGGMWIVWTALILLYIQSKAGPGQPLIPSALAESILIRSVIIVFTWYVVVAPLLMVLLRKWLQKQQTRLQRNVSEVMRLLPVMQRLVRRSWEATAGKKRWSRFRLFAKIVLSEVLDESGQLYILTGPVGCGKTTRLSEWIQGKQAGGILTPVANGGRYFSDIRTGERFRMEAEPGAEKIIRVGKYEFSADAFDRARNILRQARDTNHEWLVVDEIGPLELDGKGFSEEVKSILAGKRDQNMLFVVREGLVEKAVERFGMADAVIIRQAPWSPKRDSIDN